MADHLEDHDFIDDIIDLQRSFQAVSNPLSGLEDALVSNVDGDTFNPDDYKERPWTNPTRCLSCAADNPVVCTKCTDVCPVDAITIHKQSVSISEDCRKCGLCFSVCPTDVFSTHRHMPRMLYDRIARAANAYEKVYITCTRALGRTPLENEICLPCVGALSKELWFSLLAEYDNIDVYLPEGICERCQTITGEAVYVDHIGDAETWAETTVGLIEDEKDKNLEFKRAYLRSQFMSSMINQTERLLTGSMPMLAGAKAIANRIQAHSKKVDSIQHQVETAVGIRTAENRQRMMVQNRKLVMAALTQAPDLAKNLQLEVPVWDRMKCTLCGQCSLACTPRAINIDKSGNLTIADEYCVGCAVCEMVCPEDALAMEKRDGAHLVKIDHEALEAARKAEELKAQSAELIQKGKKQLKTAADFFERLAEEDE